MNNLRRDIHSAFEVIEPPLGGMPERVVQTVLAEKNGRLRKEKMVYRLRISLALVAAVLVVAVGAAAVITWNSLHNSNLSPAGHAPATLAQLEARPLKLQLIKASDPCPAGPFDASGEYGSGPFHAVPGQAVDTSWGRYFFLNGITDPGLTGLVLIRVAEARSGTRIVFVDSYSAGPSLGTDTLRGKTVVQRPELALDMSHPPSRPVNGQTFWSFTLGVPSGYVGTCYGWQVDGDINGQPFVEIFHT